MTYFALQLVVFKTIFYNRNEHFRRKKIGPNWFSRFKVKTSNFLTPISLQPGGVNLLFFNLDHLILENLWMEISKVCDTGILRY